MKITHLTIIFGLLLLICAGCQPAAPTNQLTVSADKVCLQFEGKETCIEGKSGTFRLRLVNDKPVLEAMDLRMLEGQLSFPQYSQPQMVKTEAMGVIIENRVLRVESADSKFSDVSGLGICLVKKGNGPFEIFTADNVAAASTTYQWGRNGLVSNKKVNRIVLSAGMPSKEWMYLRTVSYSEGDAANHYIPNDTGTEVVIIDNFKVRGNCDAPAPETCCPDGEAAGAPLDISNWIAGYEANSLNLLACFPVGSICTFTEGDKLIILLCESQKRYCIDFSVCAVTITTSDEQGICFSVPVGCAVRNPF